MDTYASQLTVVTREKSDLDKNIELVKEKLKKSETQAVKAVELEANLICLKESEKQLQAKTKTLESALDSEKRSSVDNDSKNLKLSSLLEKTQDSLNEEKKKSKKLEDELESVKQSEESLGQTEGLLALKLEEIEKLTARCAEMEEIIMSKNKTIENSRYLREYQEDSFKDSRLELESKNAALINDLNELNEEMKRRGERLDKLEQANNEKADKIKSLEQENKDRTSADKAVEHLLRDLEVTDTRLAEVNEECVHWEEETKILEKKVNKLSEEKEKQKMDLVNEMRGQTENFQNLRTKYEEEQEQLKLRIENLETKLEEQTNLSQDQAERIESKDAEISKYLDEIQRLKVDNSREESQSKLLNEQKSKIESQSSNKDNQIEELGKKLKESEISRNKIVEELQHALKENESELENLRTNKANSSEEVIFLQEQLTKISGENKKLSSDLVMKSTELTSLQASFDEMDQNADEQIKTTKLLEEELKELKEKFARTSQEKDSLDLKVIESDQRTKILELKLKDLSNEVLEENHLLKENISDLMKTIEELKEEASKNKSLNSSGQDLDDSRSEVMSTSTVSRVEEVNRMKDIEDSFEDRYNKLKLIAIKLKKKVADQDRLIKELQASKVGEQDTENQKEKIASLTKNFGNLQQQYDEAMDKHDSCVAELKTLKKDLEASIAENILNKQKSEESLQQALGAKTEQTKTEERAREAEGQLRSLEVTLEQERRERRSLETSCRTNEDLSTRLKEKVEENRMIGETVHTLKLQITQLEETLDREKDRADSAQGNLTATRGQLTQTEAELARLNIEKDEIFCKYEKSIQSAESLQEQLATNIQATDKSGSDKENKIHQLERLISALESSVQTKSLALESKETELSQVNKEFENYKLRAQSVLKQSKEKVNEEEAKKKQDDIIALDKMNDALNEKLKSLSVELRTLTIERNGIQDEHDRLMSRHSQLMQESASKEKAWREKMEQKELTIKKGEEDKAGSQERSQKSLETLKQAHRRELQTTKSSHSAEISKLVGQLDSTENEVIRLELVLQKEQEARRLAEELLGKVVENGNSFDNKLDIREIEREACEGQEVDSLALTPGVNAVTSPLPLDQLLAQSDLPGKLFIINIKILTLMFTMSRNICLRNPRAPAQCTCAR